MTGGSQPIRIQPLVRPPDVTVRVPGSKSLTNRALVCAAMAEGTSVLEGALRADDTEAMIHVFTTLGIKVVASGTTITVEGAGGAVPSGPAELDARLSGTTSRFLAPLLASGTGPYRLDGAPPLRARPMGPLVEGLRSLGCEIAEEGRPGCLPLMIGGGAKGGRVHLAGNVSSQFVSGLLLAGPLFTLGVEIDLTTGLVSVPYVEMTRAVMRSFGAAVDGTTVPAGGYTATTYVVEPDASAASYFFAAAAITGGRVTVEGLDRGSLQGDLGFVDLLARMGAEVESSPGATTVTGTGTLRGIRADLADLSDMAQTLAVVAIFAESPTTVTGIGFIRHKETDRIGNTVRELRRCGIQAFEEPDGFTIHPGRPRGGVLVETHEDHRMAMSFALVGLGAEGIDIADPGCVAKTYPSFFEDLVQLRQ